MQIPPHSTASIIYRPCLIAGPLIVLLSWFLLQPRLGLADWKDDIGFTELAAEQGADLPTGAGIPVSLVEAAVEAPKGAYYPYLIPTITNPELTGVTFIDGTGSASNGISGHSQNMAENFFGNSLSLAPAADLVYVLDADDFLTNKLKSSVSSAEPAAPTFTSGGTQYTYLVQNNSWIGTMGTNSRNLNALQRLDYVIDTYGVTTVVGRSASIDGGPNNVVAGNAYNTIAVSTLSGFPDSSTTLSNYGPGRVKPDIVAPGDNPSTSTARVSSAATFLHEVVAGSDAAHPETIKAILLAGATKDEIPDWSNSSTQPLMPGYGAGELNIYNSFHIANNAKTSGSTATPPSVPGSGWDYQIADGIQDVLYNFEVPAGETATELSIVLAWNVEIQDTNSGSGFSPVDNLADLNLGFAGVAGSEAVNRTALSISDKDNLEHIYLTDLPSGTYTLNVSSDMQRDYGLAWRMSTVAASDFNEDGQVDGNDFLAWQLGFGSLNPTHEMGDANGDGAVDSVDLAFWKSQYGGTNQMPLPALAQVFSIPEPDSVILAYLFLGLLPILTRSSARARGQ